MICINFQASTRPVVGFNARHQHRGDAPRPGWPTSDRIPIPKSKNAKKKSFPNASITLLRCASRLTAHRIRAPSSPCPLPAAVALPPPSMGTARRSRTQRPGNRKSPLAIFPLFLTFVSPNPKLPNPSERAVTDLGEAMVCREGVDRTPECQVCRILGWAATGQPCGGRAAGGCAWRRWPSEEQRACGRTA